MIVQNKCGELLRDFDFDNLQPHLATLIVMHMNRVDDALPRLVYRLMHAPDGAVLQRLDLRQQDMVDIRIWGKIFAVVAGEPPDHYSDNTYYEDVAVGADAGANGGDGGANGGNGGANGLEVGSCNRMISCVEAVSGVKAVNGYQWGNGYQRGNGCNQMINYVQAVSGVKAVSGSQMVSCVKAVIGSKAVSGGQADGDNEDHIVRIKKTKLLASRVYLFNYLCICE